MSDPTNQPPNNPYGEQPPPSNPSNPYGQAEQPAANPYGQSAPAYGAPSYGTGDPDKRPGTVTAASIITIVVSGLGVLIFSILAAVLQGSDEAFDDIYREIEDQRGMEDLTPSEVLDILTVFLVIFAIWSLIALVLAVLAMRRHNWARILVVISAVVSGLLSLLMILSAVSAIPLIASIAAVALYFTGGANQWYARKGQQQQTQVYG